MGKVINTTQGTTYSTIQAAITASSNNNIIVVAKGTYTGSGNRDLDFGGKAINVQSIDPNDWKVVAATVIDCNGTSGAPHRGFYFHNAEGATSVVAGFTITNGFPDANGDYYLPGGGIFCHNSSPTIRNCIITGNSKKQTVGDRYTDGGGIACYNGSNPNITNCIIKDNEATYSGGISCDNSDPIITNCLISDNTPYECIYLTASEAIITNCVIAGNTTGIINQDSSPTITNCIFWANGGTSQSSQFDKYSGTPVINYTCMQGWNGSLNGTANTGSDPNLLCIDDIAGPDGVFGTCDDGLQVWVRSCCVDAANSNAASFPATDITGSARIDVPYISDDGAGTPAYADIGAYESPTGMVR